MFQELIESLDFNSKITLFTNDNIFIDLDQSNLKNTLLNLKHTSIPTNFETIFIKLNNQKHNYKNTLSKFILISDFQGFNKETKEIVTNVNSSISLINVSPTQFRNISIDSVYLAKKSTDQIHLKVIISNTNTSNINASISLLNNDILIGKTTTPLLKNKTSEIEFSVPSQENFKGKLIIEDHNLQFDNTLFFNLNKPIKINVLSIGNSGSFFSQNLHERRL